MATTLLTDEETFAEMNTIALADDDEDRHYKADEVLLRILRQHGFEKTADAYEDMTKWYA